MNFIDNLKKLQAYLKENNIDFYLVFSNDEFLHECSDLNNNARYLISGFSGSAGDMLVSQNNAYLFVDGRYHIQVDEQTDGKYITPVKLQMGEKRNDKIFEIIKSSKLKNPKIAFCSNKISILGFKLLDKSLKRLHPQFLKQEIDIVCKFFATKDEKRVYKIWKTGIEQSGKLSCEKLKELKKYENDVLLVFSNDEICYLANIRSNQNPYSSSLNAFGLVGEGVLRVFCELNKVPAKVKNSDKTVLYKDFSEFENELKFIKGTIFYEASNTPLALLEKIEQLDLPVKKIAKSPVAKMKSIKNATELAYIKECYEKSDIAISRAIKWLVQEVKNKNSVTAGDFMQKLQSEQELQGIIGLSFKPILAINERSAIIHCTEYNPNQKIKENDFILLDFGVYFEGGYATDMTRTFAVSSKFDNLKMKKVYTTVLKSFLNVLNYPITEETTFFDLDKKARDIISASKIKGFNFNHGTGHGIGLNVHEAPPVLSPSKMSKKKIKAGMVFSIEPGMYKENIGGVRLENSVCTIKTAKGIEIRTLTNLSFDEKMIIIDLLNKKEKTWLVEYQKKAIK